MTAQISDSFLFRATHFGIVGINGTGLFDPKSFGLRPASVMSACWRGYICEYGMADDCLELRRLSLFLDGQDRQDALSGVGPRVFDQPPQRPASSLPSGDRKVYCFRYEHLAEPIRFTGGLLLGADFIKELYVHMGFHPAWKYRQVQELIFADSRLIETIDRSRAIEDQRRQLADSRIRPDLPANPADPSAVHSWIDKAFSMKYGKF